VDCIEKGIDFVPSIKEFPVQFIDIIFSKFDLSKIKEKFNENDMKKTIENKSELEYNMQEVNKYLNSEDIMEAVNKSEERSKFRQSLSRNSVAVHRELIPKEQQSK
jgi:hypothetical protein